MNIRHVRGDHKVGGAERKIREKKTEQIPFGYLECSYGPRNVRNRTRRDEILLSELKDTSKVHLSSALAPFEVYMTDSIEFPLKSLWFGQWEM